MTPKDMDALRRGLVMLRLVNAQAAVDLADAAQDEPITKPPSKWRNLWRAKTATNGHCALCGEFHKYMRPAEIYLSHCSFPSSDIARAKADESMRKGVRSEYLGPVAVEE